MMSNDAISALLVFAYSAFGVFIYKKIKGKAKPKEDEQEQEQETDFEYMTVRQQIDAAQQTADALEDLEDLQLQLEESSEDSLLPVQMEWMSRDGTMHALTVYANGIDVTTECLHRLTEAEIHDTKKLLAYQCKMLATHKRSTQNGTQNDAKSKERGGEDVDKILRKVRETN